MRIRRNPWHILGLEQGADPEEIKSAYRKAVMLFHPDKGGDPEKFALVTDAYDKLKNKKHIPVLSVPNTVLVNVKLTTEQQIKGVSGYVETDKGFTLELKIPPGARSDDRFKVRTDGKSYIINIQEKTNKVFTRQGFNCIMNLNIDIIDAMIGGTITTEGPDGDPLEIQIPAGAQNNQLLVISGRGLYNRKRSRRGNLHIFLNINIPKLNTSEDVDSFIKRLKNE